MYLLKLQKLNKKLNNLIILLSKMESKQYDDS